ncbi:MAG: hypothetical protein OEW08_07870 [Gammaproteobacteria bacterium]|nr:hypothetical protein [Gammaproteobacteria bacterium]
MSTLPIAITLVASRRDVEQEQMLAATDGNYKIETTEAADWRPHDPLLELRFIEPMQLVVVTSLTHIVQRLCDAWLRDAARGVEILLDDRPHKISRLSGIPAGYLVVSRNGKAVVAVRAADYDATGLAVLLAPYL